ncbi:triose-phosphate transporter family-domain-containing protein [Powellomyces hirtus]|nr:triose-phosphate transporter family-domain-containing protein [Powellomyces hirtus]
MTAHASTSAAVPAPPSLLSTCLYLAVYFSFNLTLTLYNKLIFSRYSFPFPWTLTAIHTFSGTLGCYICAATGIFVPATLGKREKYVMLAFSVLYTVNIAISNVSLNLVTVPFHQVVRSTVPLFTVGLSTCFLNITYSRAIYISLLPIVCGVIFATSADYTFTTLGLVLTLLGTLLAAIKTIVTNVVQVGSLKLHPLDLLLRMSPLAFIQTVAWSFVTGESEAVLTWWDAGNLTWVMGLLLAVNGGLAFGLNVASFVANKRTGALTMCVAGNVKQVLSIVLSVIIFKLAITTTNAMGILITLTGGVWYTYVDYREKRAPKPPAASLPTEGLSDSSERLLEEGELNELQEVVSKS